MRYFEDIELGVTEEIGSYTFTEEEIIRFAEKYDRQVFHLDPEKAKETPFGGLIASGWHTAAVYMGTLVRWVAKRSREAQAAGRDMVHAGASPGFEDLRWIKPVRPGDTLTFYTTATEKRPLKSRPDYGLLLASNEAYNQKGELVYRFTGKGFIPRRGA